MTHLDDEPEDEPDEDVELAPPESLPVPELAESLPPPDPEVESPLFASARLSVR
jgi:hypothetical protein